MIWNDVKIYTGYRLQEFNHPPVIPLSLALSLLLFLPLSILSLEMLYTLVLGTEIRRAIRAHIGN